MIIKANNQLSANSESTKPLYWRVCRVDETLVMLPNRTKKEVEE